MQVCAKKECNMEGWRGKEAKKGGDRIEIICCGVVCRVFCMGLNNGHCSGSFCIYMRIVKVYRYL